MKRLTRTLLKRSEQAFSLSIEIFNKPTIDYRVEGFCFFFINAWELLAKAHLVHSTRKDREIFYPKKRNAPRRSISLRDALARAIANPTDPVRRNVEQIVDLRDQATHLFIPDLEAVYAGLFQAGVFNYVDQFETWFGRKPMAPATPPLLSLVWDTKEFDPKVVARRYGKAAWEFLRGEAERIRTLEKEISDRRFSISIEYKLVLTKKPQDADITLAAGPGGGVAGKIIEVPKDISVTHPYTQTAAIDEIRKRLPPGTRFTTFDFQAVVHKERVKASDSSPFHYLVKQNGTHCYSPELVDLVVNKISTQADYLQRARAFYKEKMSKAA